MMNDHTIYQLSLNTVHKYLSVKYKPYRTFSALWLLRRNVFLSDFTHITQWKIRGWDASMKKMPYLLKCIIPLHFLIRQFRRLLQWVHLMATLSVYMFFKRRQGEFRSLIQATNTTCRSSQCAWGIPPFRRPTLDVQLPIFMCDPTYSRERQPKGQLVDDDVRINQIG